MEQTESGLLVPTGTIEHREIDAKDAVARHYAGMAKLEKYFPCLVKTAVALAGQISQLADTKGLSEDAVLLDTPKWYPDGTVTVAVSLDPEAKRSTTTDKAAKNFSTLQEVNERCPQAVDLAMSLAFQLTAVMNNKKLIPGEIEATKVRWASQDQLISFRMLAAGLPLGPPLQVHL